MWNTLLISALSDALSLFFALSFLVTPILTTSPSQPTRTPSPQSSESLSTGERLSPSPATFLQDFPILLLDEHPSMGGHEYPCLYQSLPVYNVEMGWVLVDMHRIPDLFISFLFFLRRCSLPSSC
ncbi:hypothetical protein C8R46DRAFT_1106409 [Mycena filopes]|nr:hypothetical protein C8R46DRAFT_1106409 [Mycena filopes]